MTSQRTLALLLGTTGLAGVAAPAIAQEQPAQAQASPAPPAAHPPMMTMPAQGADEYEDAEEIVVTGQRPRGSVQGDIPPENILTSRDIRATGATTIGELLEAISSQTGSNRGRGSGIPVILVNGLRTSGFREVHDIPPEAIERTEILPEEVALKYGYGADQRVVNLVLRRRFNSKTADVNGRIATDGGYLRGGARGSRFLVNDDQRTTIGFEVEGNGALTEDERDIAGQPIATATGPIDARPYRTLIGDSGSMRLTGVIARPLAEATGGSFNAEVQRRAGKTLFGVPVTTLTVPTASPYYGATGPTVVRGFEEDSPLVRNSRTVSAGAGANINGALSGRWRWNAIANAEFEQSRSRADRGPDLGSVQAAINALNPSVDPRGNLGDLAPLARDRSESDRTSLAGDAILTGPLFAAPGGTANAVFKVGASTVDYDSESVIRGVGRSSDLGRTRGDASVSLDVPLAERSGKIGRLTANANAAVSTLSDFGTLTTYGAGLNWSPTSKFNALVSWTREEGAPTIQQLGDAPLETPSVPFFDFVRGETALVTTITGGNPDLSSDRRNVFKIGANWQLPTKADLRVRADFVRATIDSPIGSFPAASAELEAAFPSRFVRASDGRLLSVDLRPVNYDQARSSTFTWGLQFSKPLKTTPPSPAAINRMRERFRQMMRARGMAVSAAPSGTANAGPQPQAGTPPAGSPPAPRPTDEVVILHGGSPPPSGGGGSGAGAGPSAGGMGQRGPGGFRMMGGPGGNGGRLTFGLTHSIALQDDVTLGGGLPTIDYLDGAAYGRNGGRPRHTVQLEGGYFRDGIGIRADVDWRGATRVDSAAGSLRFSPYTDVDLRLFANLGEQFGLVAKHPFFMGSSVRLEVNNLFNARPKVRDPFGATPFTYQGAQIEPIGRTFGIGFRKLFVPLRFIRPGSLGGGRRPGG